MKSRTECSPRIIKRTNIKAQTDDAIKYGFYRQINHLSIVRLDNETGIININNTNIRSIYVKNIVNI
jgi:hypothetical protein